MVATPTRFFTPLPAPPMLLGQRLIHAVGHCTESRQMLPGMAEMIGQALAVEVCVLLVSNTNNSSLQGVVWTRSPTGTTRSQIILLGSGSLWLEHSWFKAIQSQEYPLVLTPKTTPSTTVQLTKEVVLQSGLGLRTVFQGQVNGMVIVGSSQQEDYSWEEAQLIEIADSLAIANYLVQSSQSSSTSMTAALKNVTPNRNLTTDENPIIKAWYEATRQKLEQQRQSNDQLIHNIVTIMSDQTRNPLATIRMGIEMLRKNPPSPETLKQRLDVIEQEWRKLNEINEKILQLKTLKFNRTNLQLSKVNLNSFIQQLITSYEFKWADSLNQWQLKTNLPEHLLFFNSDISYLQRIFDELLINAKKFALKNTNVVLKVTESYEEDQPCIILKVSNLTPAIKSKNLRYFFDPFYREQWVIDTAISGIGLGLTITKELVEQLNGKITVTCDPTEIPNHCLINFILTFPSNCSG